MKPGLLPRSPSGYLDPVLAHFTLGQGPQGTVVLHGFLGSGRNLRTLVQRWSERDPSRRFLVPDLTGHGESPPLPPGASLRTLAEDVRETARAAGLSEPLSWVGHSMGGRVALVALQGAPASVRELTLLDISPGPVPEGGSDSDSVLQRLRQMPADAADRAEMRERLLATRLSPGLTDWLLTNLVLVDGRYRWRLDREALGRLHPVVTAEDLWPVLEPGPPPVPTRCFRGARSHYVPDADARRMERAGVQVHTLEGAGHYVHVDALEALVAGLSTP